MQLPIQNLQAADASASAAAVVTTRWQNWDASVWGAALFAHYFLALENSEPILRLPVTTEELAKVAQARPSEASAVSGAFLAAIACTPDEFRAHLRTGRLTGGEWCHNDPPPFLPYLIFTCYAAATLDEVVADEGDFRRRIRELLRHPQGTSYDLEDLPKLWHALRRWLMHMRASGVPVRRLELPDPGYMNRIGHSVRLAFPRRSDRGRLVGVLAELSTDSVPTMAEAFSIVARGIRLFSPDFQDLFLRAKDTLAHGGDSPDLRLVWSALIDAATSKPVGRSVVQLKPRFHLLAYDDDRGRLDPVVVSDRRLETGMTGITCEELPDHVGDYTHFLGSARGGTRTIAELLFHEALADRLAGVKKTSLTRSVSEGVLLFRATDSSTWALCVTRESEGPCRAIVSRRHMPEFLRMITSARMRVGEAVAEGWDEVTGFDFADLADPVIAAPLLASIRVLQRVDAGARIQLVDGIRTTSGYLGTAALLPEVRCREATLMSVYKNVGSSLNIPALVEQLLPMPGRPGSFSWPCPRQTMGGTLLLVAANESGEVATRIIAFESAVVGEEFKSLPNAASWIAEGGAKDMVTADKIDVFLAAVEPRSRNNGGAVDPLAKDGSIALHHRTVDDDSACDDMVEAIACTGLRKQGLAEAELVDLGQAVGVFTRGEPPWSAIRAWVEAGYVDVVSNPRWRGRTYFARRPRLVAVPSTAGSVRLVLHGLASRATRYRVREVFARSAIPLVPMASLSPCVPVPLAWRLDAYPGWIEELSRGTDLPLAWAAHPDSMIGSLGEVFAVNASPPGSHSLLRSWDWVESGFRGVEHTTTSAYQRDERSAALSGREPSIVVDFHVRIDGPDEYRVRTSDGRTLAVTRSRTWALLRAFSAARRSPFSSHGDRCFIRVGRDGPVVPLPAARALQLWSGMLSGPAQVAGMGPVYIYAAQDATSRRRILNALSGHRNDAGSDRKLAWLVAAASARGGSSVLIPREIRLRLEEMLDVPDAIALARSTIPASLLPHLRRVLSPASKPQISKS